MNGSLLRNSVSHHSSHQASSLPGTPKRDRSRFIDTDGGHSVHPATVPRIFRSGSEINNVHTSGPRVNGYGRPSSAQAQMHYRPTSPSAYRVNYNDNGLASDGHDTPYSYHASAQAELAHGGPDHPDDAHFSRNTFDEYDNDDDDDDDDENASVNNDHEQQRINHVSSPRRRILSQEAPQIVPVSQASDLDQYRTFGRGSSEHGDYSDERTFQHLSPADYRDTMEYAEDDYEDEGLDVGDMDDEVYSRQLPQHAYVEEDESGDEENKEHRQLTFLHRITKTFTSLLEDIGQGTPKRYKGNGDDGGDLGMEATSARARQRLSRKQRAPPVSPSKKKSHAFIAAAEKAAELAASFATAAKTTGDSDDLSARKGLPQVPSMRHIDSGIGMSSNEANDMYPDDDDEDEIHDHWDQDPAPTSVHRQDYADDQRNQFSEEWRTVDYESTESTTEDDSPQPFGISSTMREAQMSRSRRNNTHSGSPAPTRVYPWHVIWYWTQTYSRRLADIYDSFITAVQRLVWWLVCWVYYVVTWPWVRRYDIWMIGKLWMEAGVSSGLLSPKTLAGVAIMVLAVWAQYSYTGAKEGSLGTPPGNDTLLSDPSAGGAWHAGSIFGSWSKGLWRDDPKSEREEQSRQLDMSWLSRWMPSFSSTQKPENHIQIPTDQIHSLGDLEARIEWIQKTLVELGRAEESREKSAEGAKTIGWNDFLHENERAIEKFVEGRITKVSKTVLLSLLKSEANSITQGVEKNVIAQLEKKGRLQVNKAVPKTGPGSSTTGDGKSGHPLTEEEINSMIDKALEKYSADATAKPDYALFTAGGRVIPRLTSVNHFRTARPTFWGRIGGRFLVPPPQEKGPQKAIEPSMHAGECWAMKGHQGQLAIRLARKIVITEITIEQVDPSVALDKGSSPREIEVWSLVGHEHSAPVFVNPSTPSPQTSTDLEKDGEQLTKDQKENKEEDVDSSSTSDTGVPAKNERKELWWGSGVPWPGGTLLSTIEYVAESPAPSGEDEAKSKKPKPMQMFSIPVSVQSTPSVGVLLRIKSNWGHPEFTCLYRVRIHGYEPTSNESVK
ncbi:hypothetical protein BGW38_009102 [Lunasporangiospora selenospora]|uniref:SUN domain-containing protein n=1 Tax=Lunasporangiospora selenospora TaxID=979761 RepID=A0A9P6FY05_9FUNG|nr:hypothetical protein BGW38_009102 [Lunasporangiospora selenospora]